MNPEDFLKEMLSNETARIRESYTGNDVIYGIIELIRSLDYSTYLLAHNLKPGDEILLEKYRYGWVLPFSKLYKELVLADVPIFPSIPETEKWADSVIQHSSLIQLCHQLLDYKKADLAELVFESSNSFTFLHPYDHSAEYYEHVSLAFYHGLVNKMLEDKVKKLNQGLPAMRRRLKQIVNPVQNLFISYQADEEMDKFYSRFGYLYLMTTQTIDEFDESDTFGKFLYKDFLDVAEFVCRSAIMHRDCCMALAEKTSHKVYLKNILSYGFSLSRFIEKYSDYLGWEKEKLNEIFSCFVLTKENYEYHLSSPKSSPPPYFHIGDDMLIRSSFGSLDRPVFFLNRELKRKYSKDYFKAVNRREERFRKQLYSFFPMEKIIKIDQNIVIGEGNMSTDIDAILYDPERGTLGLFQLKWQDTFYTSMKERFSRITNLIPKSVEWIDKVETWLKANNENSILRTLKLDKAGKIENVRLFVIARNHVHFTNQHLDERAIWSSWYQIIEASSKIKEPTGFDPISELAAKLMFFSPGQRKEMEKFRKKEDYAFKLGGYEINVRLKNIT